MDKIDRAVGKVFTVLTWFSIVAVLIILIITVINVITRSFFASPVFGVVDVSQLALSLVALCALPIVTMFNGHIKVDLVADHLPHRVQDGLTCANLAVCSVMLVIISIYTFEKANKVRSLGTMTGALGIPFYPVYYLIAVMMLLSAICALYNIIHFLLCGSTIGPDTFSEIKNRLLKGKGGNN